MRRRTGRAGTTQNFVVGHEVVPANVQDASLAPYTKIIQSACACVCVCRVQLQCSLSVCHKTRQQNQDEVDRYVLRFPPGRSFSCYYDTQSLNNAIAHKVPPACTASWWGQGGYPQILACPERIYVGKLFLKDTFGSEIWEEFIFGELRAKIEISRIDNSPMIFSVGKSRSLSVSLLS